MRLPSLIIASAGNGYQVLYKSKAFESLNPKDFDAMCKRMDSVSFDAKQAYFVTQSLGKMVIGRAKHIESPEYGDMKLKVTHCYFMNMHSFVDVVKGFRNQNAVIGTFRDNLSQEYGKEVEDVAFVKEPSAAEKLSQADLVDVIISLGMVDKDKKFMFSGVDPEDAIKVLFEFFPANYICDLSILTQGETETNDTNILFGDMNILSDNKVISIHTAANGISSLTAEITEFVISSFRKEIVEIMEHVSKIENGYLAELVSVTRVITKLESTGVLSASNIIKLMDKASTMEDKMSIFGILVDIKSSIPDSRIIDVEMIEKYWAFVLFKAVSTGDKKNAALVHNVCTCLKGVDRSRYLGFVREAIALKYTELDDENLALLVLLAHEKERENTKLLNNRFDVRKARSFIKNKISIANREENVEKIMVQMVLS
ncbi:MAG: hypothetical protein E7254_11235 [Lachnospiraceae bacterium]|nr:hypothetical protein [Lachnospiraceae bacterium]